MTAPTVAPDVLATRLRIGAQFASLIEAYFRALGGVEFADSWGVTPPEFEFADSASGCTATATCHRTMPDGTLESKRFTAICDASGVRDYSVEGTARTPPAV